MLGKSSQCRKDVVVAKASNNYERQCGCVLENAMCGALPAQYRVHMCLLCGACKGSRATIT